MRNRDAEPLPADAAPGACARHHDASSPDDRWQQPVVTGCREKQV